MSNTHTSYSDALTTSTANTEEAIHALDMRYVMPTYTRKNVAFVEGHGMELTSTEGKTYLDFLSGIGTIGLGHSNEAVVQTLTEQAGKLMHVSNIFDVENRGELAADLTALANMDGQVFFANSGAEANECALKLARKWGHAHKPDATRIITLEGSFHGRTLGTIAATGQEKFSAPFAPVMPGFATVPLNDEAALEAALNDDAIALMIEVVQGESGVWPAAPSFVKLAEKLCHERNVLLIIDEVQSGMFRTGTPYAFQNYGIEPDMFTLAKALGNGFPIGATVAKTSLAAEFAPGDHGTTFGGNVLACTVARTVVKELAQLADTGHIDEVGAYAREQLAHLDGVLNVRGIGLMIGFTLVAKNAQEVAARLLEQGFIVNAIGTDHVRILPPLICENAHIDALIDALYAIIDSKDKE